MSSEYGKEEVNHVAMITVIAYTKNTVARYLKASFETNTKLRIPINRPSSIHIKLKISPPLAKATDGITKGKTAALIFMVCNITKN